MILRSIVLRVVAVDTVPAHVTHGHHAHALFMDLVRRANPDLAQRLHDWPGDKPFTVSQLLRAQRTRDQSIHLALGGEYEMRFTLLSEELYTGLATLLLRRGIDAPLLLGPARLSLQSVAVTADHAQWAGMIETHDLQERARPCREIRLQFYSPTAFSFGERSWGRQMDILPRPESVFDSLARRWNALVATADNSQKVDRRALEDFVRERVRVSRLQGVESRALQFGSSVQIGFTGVVTYTVQGLDSAQDGAVVLARARLLDQLANFAFFSGVGYKTTMGMGQTRRWTEVHQVPENDPGHA